MLTLAHHRRFTPDMVLMDSWYASLETLKLISGFNWVFVTRLRSNRTVSTAPGKENRFKISELQISEEGMMVHLKGFGQIKVFLIDFPNGNKEYMATNQQISHDSTACWLMPPNTLPETTGSENHWVYL